MRPGQSNRRAGAGGRGGRARSEPGRAAEPCRPLAWLWGVLLVGLGVRLLYQAQLGDTPFGHFVFLDSDRYDRWASSIAAGDWLGGPRPFFFDPGYAYLLAFVEVLGGGQFAVRLLQSGVGLATVAVTALLARRLAGQSAGLLAGAIAALYLPLVYFEGLVLKTTLEVFLCALLPYLLLRAVERGSGSFAWILIGLGAGVACTIKSNFLVVVPVTAAWLAWMTLRKPSSSASRLDGASTAPAARRAGLFLAGVLAVVGTVALRNRVVSGEWIALTYASGINFYIGNGPHADGSRAEPPFIRPMPDGEELDGNAEARRRAGRELGHAEISRFWWQQTWSSIGGSPARWARLLGVKLLAFWNRVEVTDNVSLAFVRTWVPVLRWPLPGFWLVGPLGIAGMAFASWKRDPEGILLVALVLVQCGGVVLFHVADRYRLPVVPLLVALGAAAVVEAFRRRGRAAVLVGAAAAVGVLVVDVLPSPNYASGQSLANHHEMLGVAHASRGEAAPAIEAFRRAVALEPRRDTGHYNLAEASYVLAHDAATAEAEARTALALTPGYGDAHFLLGRILLESGRSEEAAREFLAAARAGSHPLESYLSAAAGFGRAQRMAEAASAVDAALELAADDPHALELLGNVRLSRGDAAGALEAWERSLVGDPSDAALRSAVETLRDRLGR